MSKLHRKKYTRKKPYIYHLSNHQKERLLQVKRLYDENKTLDKVGEILNLSRERVRQLLNQGQQYNLFRYELTRDKDFSEVVTRISKEELIKSISNNPKRFIICANLNITLLDFFKLVRHYHIDLEDYVYDARQKGYLLRYSRIVDSLGHHPTTTEMQRVSNWRATWAAISRIWGSFDKFRQEFGIEKPQHRIHPNTLLGFIKSKQKRLEAKKNKLQAITELIKNNGPINCSNLQLLLGIKRSTLNSYLKELINLNIIIREGDSWHSTYIIK